MERLNVNNAIIGNHVKLLGSYSNERRWKCNPKSAKDIDVPIPDIIKKHFLPNLSTRNIDAKPATIVENPRIVTTKLGFTAILLFIRIISA